MGPRSHAIALVVLGIGCSAKTERSPVPTTSASASPAPAVASASASVSAAPTSSAPTTPVPSASVTKIHREPHLAWRQLELVNWQAVSDDLPPLPPETPAVPSECPTGMLWVGGEYLLDRHGRADTDEVLLQQNAACALFRTSDHGTNALCDRFDRDAWLRSTLGQPRVPMSVCIDRYEYPNVYGQYPLVVVTYAESQAYCARSGKRLCTESEWTFACEGEEAFPYPYGYERDTTACNIGVMGTGPDKDTFSPRTTEHTARGIDLAWRGKRSGESPRCVSPFGVADMTGNVDEWTRTVRRYGYEMIMLGGHWGPARQRCRPQTRGHGPHYVRYDQGFRCCHDTP